MVLLFKSFFGKFLICLSEKDSLLKEVKEHVRILLFHAGIVDIAGFSTSFKPDFEDDRQLMMLKFIGGLLVGWPCNFIDIDNSNLWLFVHNQLMI